MNTHTYTPPPPPRTLIKLDPKTGRFKRWERDRIDWLKLQADMNEVQERTVLGWVKAQDSVPWDHLLKRMDISRRFAIPANWVQVEVNEHTSHTTRWFPNEISPKRTVRKYLPGKNETGEERYDLWVRWTPPTKLTAEQLEVVRKRTDQIRRNEEDSAREYQQYVLPRKVLGEKLRAMDSWAREIYHLEDGVEHLPPHLRERDERRATLLKRVRLIAHRKNQRMGQEGWREWRISITREMAERGKKLAPSDQTV